MYITNKTSLTKSFAFASILAAITFLFGFSSADPVSFSTDFLTMSMDRQGNITVIKDKTHSKDYFPSGEKAPLLSLYKDSAYIRPLSMEYNESKNRITLRYPNGSAAVISVMNKNPYLRFELVSLLPRNGVEAIVWGPYPTTIRQSIGETICIVHDDHFAFGMQGLNINTIEGLPEGNDNSWGGSFIEPLPGQILPDSLKDQIGKEVEANANLTGDIPEYVRTYRGTAAVKKPYGSEIRLFARDRRIGRLVKNVYSKDGINMQYVEPINVDFAGSAIAVFGCPEQGVLDIIEKIELNEKLPHPMLNGEWIKRSATANNAYLMFEGKDIGKGLDYAAQFGFTLMHIGEIFKTWGHFKLETDRFPGGGAEIKKVTTSAAQKGVSLGAHTLTMFTATDDAYISPIPSDSLCKVGSTLLTRDIGENDKIVFIESSDYLNKLYGIKTVKLGKELITFREISADKPWRLLDCKRGQYNTKKSAHKAKSVVDELLNNSYGGFYPNIHLQDTYAKRLAEVCNETGLGLMDFDGMGGESPSGHGAYGVNKFIDLWYKNLDKYLLTCGAGTTHYYWHIYSFMNWGEPWYSALRESQVNARIETQRFLQRNYMSPMLGWFNIGPDYRPEEIEWIQARSAAFNAGYLLRVDETLDNNGYKDAIFEAVREWQKARKAGAFNPEQVARFKNPKNEFHLSKTSENSWDLFPVTLRGGFEQKFRRVQTGEPVATAFKVTNDYETQPLQFFITAVESGGNKTETVSHILLEINNYQTLEINETLKAGDRIVCDGKSVTICDANWNKRKQAEIAEIPELAKGNNDIVIKTEFSNAASPVLQLEFKTMGKAEKVEKRP